MAVRSFEIQLGLGLLVLFVGLPARAGQREDIARTEVAAGTAAYNLGYYEDAARHYEEAYRQVSDPALLFNIGQAYRLAGKPDRAIVAYRSYLRTAPADAANRAQVEKRIPELEKLVAQMKKEQTAPPGETLPTAPPAATPPVVQVQDSVPAAPPAALPPAFQVQGSIPTAPPAATPPAVPVQASVPAGPPATTPPAAFPPAAQMQGSALPAAAPSFEQGASNSQIPVAPASPWPAPPAIQPMVAMPPATDLHAQATTPAAESPSVFTTWWFWTGVGVVVAAGVITAIVLSSGSSNGIPSTTLGNQPIFQP